MVNENLIRILSDLFVNLSAGWFGAAIVIPLQNKLINRIDWITLMFDLSFGILSIAIAYYLIELI